MPLADAGGRVARAFSTSAMVISLGLQAPRGLGMENAAGEPGADRRSRPVSSAPARRAHGRRVEARPPLPSAAIRSRFGVRTVGWP